MTGVQDTTMSQMAGEKASQAEAVSVLRKGQGFAGSRSLKSRKVYLATNKLD